jgi:hypothetical protein
VQEQRESRIIFFINSSHSIKGLAQDGQMITNQDNTVSSPYFSNSDGSGYDFVIAITIDLPLTNQLKLMVPPRALSVIT